MLLIETDSERGAAGCKPFVLCLLEFTSLNVLWVVLACAVHISGHWSAHATVGNWEKWCKAALARLQPQPEDDCWKWPFALAVTRSLTAKFPEEMPQKCAAGRDAVQTVYS